MKRNSVLASALLTICAFAVQTAPAQITITIPKLPKIKKEKPQPQPEPPTAAANDQSGRDEPTSESATPETPADNCSGNGWLTVHLDEIGKRQKETDSFTAGRDWFNGTFTYDHLLFAVSPSARERWLTDSNALEYRGCIDPALDKLAASAAKKLPLYRPDTKAYGFRSPADEKLMKSKINDLADHKIHYIGVKQANWLIQKNDFGIPTVRYKHGMAWVRYMPNDHPYCRIYYINLKQDYAGGGTYGATYAAFVGEELAGCPAGK